MTSQDTMTNLADDSGRANVTGASRGTAFSRFWKSLASGTGKFAKLVLPFFLVFALLAAFIWLWIALPESRTTLTFIAAFVALTGVFPVAYIASLGLRGDSVRERLKTDFMLLGLVEENELEDTVNNLYKTVYNPAQYLAYISLIVLMCVLVVTAFLNKDNLAIMDSATIELVFFAFLGAYVFAVQELIRRYNTFDLLPQVYSSILMRIIVASVITFVGSAIINLSASDFGGTAWAAIIAFVIGVFPKRGVDWFSRRTNGLLNPTARPDDERPLEHILGISPLHSARLMEMGIDDAQNLATTDIRKLLLTTQFDTQLIVSWIDQSILFTKVGRLLYRFRESNINTFHELRTLVDEVATRQELALPEQEDKKASDRLTGLIALLGISSLEELTRLADYSNYPNYAHIIEYYSHTEEVTRQRATSATESLIGTAALTLTGGIELGSDRRISEAEQRDCLDDINKLLSRLRRDPNNANYLLQLGILYSCVGRTDKAEKSFSDAIRQDKELAEAYYNRAMLHITATRYDQAIRDCTDAIRLKPTFAKAFNSRGFAYMKTRYFDRAIEDFNRALQLDNQLAIAYLNRGIVKNAQYEFGEARKDFEITHLLGYREASLWVSWAIALINLEEYEEAVERLSHAVLYDSEVAVAYAKRGWAYFLLGEDYYGQARNDLQTALRLDDTLFDAHNNLGLLEVASGNYEAAEQHYLEALERIGDDNENLAVKVQSNLASAYVNLEKTEEAKGAFEKVVSLAPAASTIAVDANKNLGLMEDQVGNYEAAASHFEAVLREIPNEYTILYKLGRVYFKEKEWVKARQVFLQIVNGDREEMDDALLFDAYENLGAIAMVLANYSAATNHYLAALNLNADNNVIRYNLALSYLNQGQIPDADREFRLVKEAAKGTALANSAEEHLQALTKRASRDGQQAADGQRATDGQPAEVAEK